jgi:hypothetical protein
MRTLAVLFVAAVAAASASAAPPPSLRLAASNPVVVAGRSFKPLEQVRVTLLVQDQRLVRSIRASAPGTFTVSFPAVVHDPCTSALAVRAVGAGGSRATMKLIPRMCPAP